MKISAATLLALLLAASAPQAQVTPSPQPQDPGTAPIGGGDGPTPGQAPVKPRATPPSGPYGGPGDTVPPQVPPVDPPAPGPAGDDPTNPFPSFPPPADGPGGGPPPVVGGPQIGGPNDPSTLSDAVDLDLTAWTWWWELNREPFLVLPDFTDPARPKTGSGEDFLGQPPPATRLGAAPTEATLFGEVVPALLAALDRERSGELASAAAIALARIGSSRAQDKKQEYAAVLRRVLAEGDLQQQQAALIALGLLGHDGSAPFLAGVLLESRDAREALGRTRLPDALRAYAAYALGLLGDVSQNEDVRRYAVHQLVWCLETDKSESLDLASACVNALGVIAVLDAPVLPTARGETAPPGASLGAQVDYLLSLLEGRRDARLRAQVPIALGRLLQRADGERREELRTRVADALMDRLAAHRREPREVVQSCVIALGQIGDDDEDDVDRRVRRVLLRVEDLVNDIAARQYALISLGRVCGRAGENAPDPLRDERAYLLHELGRGGTLARPWAALAIGVWCRAKPGEEDLLRALRVALDDARTDRDQGAFALASGLARDAGAASLLVRRLGSEGAETTRGHAALALGLTGEPAARAPLLAAVPEARFQPALLHDAGLGLALLGDAGVIPALDKVLDGASALTSQAAAGLALSRTKDERAVDALLEILADPARPAIARAYAAAGLGHLGDPRPLRWTATYAVDANLHAAPPSLIDPYGGGLLNLR